MSADRVRSGLTRREMLVMLTAGGLATLGLADSQTRGSALFATPDALATADAFESVDSAIKKQLELPTDKERALKNPRIGGIMELDLPRPLPDPKYLVLSDSKGEVLALLSNPECVVDTVVDQKLIGKKMESSIELGRFLGRTARIGVNLWPVGIRLDEIKVTPDPLDITVPIQGQTEEVPLFTVRGAMFDGKALDCPTVTGRLGDALKGINIDTRDFGRAIGRVVSEFLEGIKEGSKQDRR